MLGGAFALAALLSAAPHRIAPYPTSDATADVAPPERSSSTSAPPTGNLPAAGGAPGETPPAAPAPATLEAPQSPAPPPLAGPAAVISVAPARAAGSAVDFATAGRTLSRVAACAPTGEIPARFDKRVVDSHCRILNDLETRWREHWLARARPFFDAIVPADLPTQIVYPFGGGDLLTALVVFPTATDITTLSLEPAGDARSIDRLPPQDLAPILTEVRAKVNHLFELAHSKTIDMGMMARSKIPGDLTYALAALVIHDMELLSLRYFRLSATGQIQYLTQLDVDAADAAEGGSKRTAFQHLEIEFQPRAGGPRRVFRHIAANLDDIHLHADPSVLLFLESKGQIAAMTKAASYLLWWTEFTKIRNYLLEHMVWMVSDSTGVSPDEAQAAGFEQIPYGRFDGPFFRVGKRATELLQKLWAEHAQPLTFRFGYPDNAGHDHLLITRRRAQ
jgi:hypothetical protein